MTTPFVGEIQIFGFNYAPDGWLPCDGATLSVSLYPVLYALIGITYGGNGTTNFQVPNFTGRAACGTLDAASAKTLNRTVRTIGKGFGETAAPLVSDQMPLHAHTMTVYRQSTALKNAVPASNNFIAAPSVGLPFVSATTGSTTFAANAIGSTGGGLPHENRQPLLALNFCIATVGEYPQFP